MNFILGERLLVDIHSGPIFLVKESVDCFVIPESSLRVEDPTLDRAIHV
jgi:hypothetical protein